MFTMGVAEAPFDALEFEYPSDEDGFGFAIVELSGGCLVAVVDVLGNPVPGALLYRTGETDNSRILEGFVREFGLGPEHVRWTPP